jgi:hypothetical protein
MAVAQPEAQTDETHENDCVECGDPTHRCCRRKNDEGRCCYCEWIHTTAYLTGVPKDIVRRVLDAAV